MNMASMCILLIVTVISISVGNANTEFPSLECKAENLGLYDQQSLLECVMHIPQADTEIRVVTWKTASRDLLVFHEGNYLEKQRGYAFAEPSWNIRNMNVSLLITNTTVEDDGRYECMVTTDRGFDMQTLSLKVTAKYRKPTIRSNPEGNTLNTDGTLTCESDDGYPKGELRWFDEHDRDLTIDSQMEAKPTRDGLFQLSSKLVLRQGSDASEYTCGVFNASGGKEEETTFKVPNTSKAPEKVRKDLDPATKIAAPIVVIGSLIAGLLLALLIYRKRSQQARRHSTTPLMGDHREVPGSDVEEGDDKC